MIIKTVHSLHNITLQYTPSTSLWGRFCAFYIILGWGSPNCEWDHIKIFFEFVCEWRFCTEGPVRHHFLNNVASAIYNSNHLFICVSASMFLLHVTNNHSTIMNFVRQKKKTKSYSYSSLWISINFYVCFVTHLNLDIII